jgi:hypothetical protein
VDTNKDGVCDRYETVTAAFGISGEYHEYHYGPVVDSLGRKYASLNLASRGEFIVPDGKEEGKGGGNMAYNAPWRGWVYRSDRAGHFQPLAGGFRSPCGIGMSPRDELFITDNEGDWVADCCLYHVREGNFYGHPASLPARPDFTKEKVLAMAADDFAKLRTLPAVWFRREIIANSPGSPVWDTTGGKFGPFKGQMFIGDQRQSNYFRCGVEMVDGDYQGWVVDFLRGLESGPVKMAFDSQGRLWSAQVGRGWFSVGGKRTALQYAEWDGKTIPFAIHSATLTKTGFDVTFTQPLADDVKPLVTAVFFRNLWIVDDVDYDATLDSFRANFGDAQTSLAKASTSAPKATSTNPKPASNTITVLPANMVRDMDRDRDGRITPEEFIAYRVPQFDQQDKNRDGFLDATEFPHPGAFKGGDKNADGKLSREEHLAIFRGQFPGNDTNGDGVITAADKKKR